MTQLPGNTIATGRDADGRFLKGVSGNDSGRPKGTVGLASYFKSMTDDGQEIADFMLGVMRGEPIEGNSPRIVERIEAARWLADRAWGRPLQQTDINIHKESLDLTEVFRGMSMDEVRAIARGEHIAKLEIEGTVIELDVPQS